MKKTTYFAAVAAALAVSALSLQACNQPTADQKQNRMQEDLLNQSVQTVGIPAITEFAEKRQLKDIYELRDKLIPTYTYLAGELNGTIGEKVCDSLGFGIPYATQYTSPQRRDWNGGNGSVVLPQADPNGLFSPASAEGTWILCRIPGEDKAMPQYVEPKVIVLTFPKESRDAPAPKTVEGILPPLSPIHPIPVPPHRPKGL